MAGITEATPWPMQGEVLKFKLAAPHIQKTDYLFAVCDCS